ncbi:MAG: tetratricopeptide repeat protein [bacterium]
MEELGLNNDITVGGRKFHIQTNFSKPQESIISNVFLDGQVIDTKRVPLKQDASIEDIDNRMVDTHREMTTEMEILYYIAEKVKTVRHAPSANKLGLMFLKKNLVEESIEQFQLALEIDPDYHEVYANLGKALIFSEAYDQAIETLSAGADRAPDFADMQNFIGIACLRAGNYEQATAHLEEALKLNPDYVEAHYNLGVALLRDGAATQEDSATEQKRQRALEHLSAVAGKVAHADMPNLTLALELMASDNYDEALERLTEGESRDVFKNFFNFENEFYLKFMYGGKGKDDSFIAEYVNDLKQLIEEYPHYADVRSNLGIAYLIQCRNLFLKSLEEFRTALKINPDFKKAEKNLKLAENDGKGFLILLRALLK